MESFCICWCGGGVRYNDHIHMLRSPALPQEYLMNDKNWNIYNSADKLSIKTWFVSTTVEYKDFNITSNVYVNVNEFNVFKFNTGIWYYQNSDVSIF